MEKAKITWDDVIRLSEEYIDMLLIGKMHSVDFLDLKYKSMWQKELALALCRHQEIFILAGGSPSGRYGGDKNANREFEDMSLLGE